MDFGVICPRERMWVLLLACMGAVLQGQTLQWIAQGASPNRQLENIDGEEVTGGIQAVAVQAHRCRGVALADYFGPISIARAGRPPSFVRF